MRAPSAENDTTAGVALIGFQDDLRKVALVKMLQRTCKLGLKDAKRHVDDLINGNIAVLWCDKASDARHLGSLVQDLGAVIQIVRNHEELRELLEQADCSPADYREVHLRWEIEVEDGDGAEGVHRP